MSDQSFLHQDAGELQQFLVQQARLDRAPRGAQERALVRLASVSVAAGLTASAKLAWGASATSKVTPWLVAKWIALGMTATLTTFAAAEGLHHAFSAQHTSAAQRTPAPQRARPSPPPSAERAAESQSAPLAVAPSPSDQTASGAPSRSAPPAADAPAPTSAQLPSSLAFDSSGSTVSAELAREVAWLKRASAALVAGSPGTALEVLGGYARAFPAGALSAEAAALRIEAVAALGNRTLAQSLASDFLTRFPSSPLLARVRAASGLGEQGNKR